MIKVKQDIWRNALTDEERFELVKKEAEINQGELSHGEKVFEFELVMGSELANLLLMAK